MQLEKSKLCLTKLPPWLQQEKYASADFHQKQEPQALCEQETTSNPAG